MSFLQNKGTVLTPAARQPQFQCSNCIRRFYNRAGLKNHSRAVHGSQAERASDSDSMASQTSSPVNVSDQHLSPQHSDNEEEYPMDVDLDVFPEEPYEHDDEDIYVQNNDLDMDLHYDDESLHDGDSSSRASSPLIIPSSPHWQHESRPDEHQQAATGDRFLRRVYHDKLNGKLLMHFWHLKLSISYVL